jgi:hypothetical protein
MLCWAKTQHVPASDIQRVAFKTLKAQLRYNRTYCSGLLGWLPRTARLAFAFLNQLLVRAGCVAALPCHGFTSAHMYLSCLGAFAKLLGERRGARATQLSKDLKESRHRHCQTAQHSSTRVSLLNGAYRPWAPTALS